MKYVPYNGSISNSQLNWLDTTLKTSYERKERVFIFCHIAVQPGSARPPGYVWNNHEILAVLHQYPNTVVAFISGHDHEGGYFKDSFGIHHIIPPAPLECDLGDVAYGYISVYSRYFELSWYGKQPTSGVNLPTVMKYE